MNVSDEAPLTEVENLKRALESRQQIGIAMGIVMERFGLDATVGFDYLVRLSQGTNTKLVRVAEQIVSTRVVPQLPSTRKTRDFDDLASS